MSETCVLPLHFGAGGMHGRKGSYHLKARKAGERSCTCVPCFFCARTERRTGHRANWVRDIRILHVCRLNASLIFFRPVPHPFFFDLRNFNGLSAARSGAASGRNQIEPSAIPAAIRKSQDTQYDGGRGSLSDGRCGKGRSPARHSDAYFFGSTPNCFWKHLAK